MKKQDKIIAMFDDISPSYDKTNRILSFGVDVSWRQRACKKVLRCFDSKNALKILDVACGTGDMIQSWQESAKNLSKKISSIRGVDPSGGMLGIAKSKFKDIEFIQALAQDLPIKDKEVDILSISYGIRNVVQRKEALSEFARVLKKDGILLVLEFTRREKGGFVAIFRDFYLKYILPKIGAYLSNNKEAYEYLPNSIDDFLSKDEFMQELREAGFEMMFYESFSFDVSSMFIARKL